jgi:hypothetical protein
VRYYHKCLAAVILSFSGFHPAAISHLNLYFDDETVKIDLNIQEITLREVTYFSLDQNHDGHVSRKEFENGWPEIDSLIQSDLWFEIEGEFIYPKFTPKEFIGGEEWENVVLTAQIKKNKKAKKFIIHSQLFLNSGNPKHKTLITAQGVGREPAQYMLSEKLLSYDLKIPTAKETLHDYIELGYEHILEGYDHLLFLIALLFGIFSIRKLFWAITSFTIAHSITLALSTLSLIALPSKLVEPIIAGSIIYVLVAHLKGGPATSKAYIPAFFFGLLHGFGFASVLGEIGLASNAKFISLLGFNLGVEIGQVFFLSIVLLAINITKRLIKIKIARTTLALPISAIALHYLTNALGSSLAGILCLVILVYSPWPKNSGCLPKKDFTINSILIFLAYNVGKWIR